MKTLHFKTRSTARTAARRLSYHLVTKGFNNASVKPSRAKDDYGLWSAQLTFNSGTLTIKK